MKKIILVFFCCLSLIPLMGQEGETYFGIQVSPTVSWIQSDDNLINSNGIHLGLKVGGVGEYYIDDWLILSGGFGFSFSQGGKLHHNIGGNLLPKSDLTEPQYNQGEKPLPDETDITYSLNMLEIPIALKYVFGLPGRPFDLFFTFPEFNLSVVSRSRGKIEATGIELSKQMIGEDVKPFNLSWGLGLGIQYPTVGGQMVSAGLYYQGGLADLTGNDGTQVRTLANGGFSTMEESSRGTLNALIFKFALFF